MTGGTGADLFVVVSPRSGQLSPGQYVVEDFSQAEGDKIAAGYPSQAFNTVSYADGNAYLGFGEDYLVTLVGVPAGSLIVSDFVRYTLPE